MKKKIFLIPLALLLVISLIAAGCPAPTPTTPPPTTPPPTKPPTTPAPPAKDKIVIGVVDAYTGVFAPGPLVWGTFWEEMLIADYNANGGLYIPELGKKLPIEPLKKYDSTSDTETLIRLTEKCMTEDKVDLMFAPWGTSQNFAVYSLYDKYGYPMLPHAMGSGQIVDLVLSKGAPWCFPVLMQPPFGAENAADLFQSAGASRIGIIGISDLHGIEWCGQVQAALARKGLNVVVGPELYPLTVSDLSPIIKKLKEAKVDALWASTYPGDGTLLIKQCMDLGYSPRVMFMGPGSQYPMIMVPTFGIQAMTGIMEYHGFEVDYNSSPELLALAERYKAAVKGAVGGEGFYPGPNTIAAYVCHDVLFKAVEKVGLDREKIRDALATGTFDTVLGPTKWDWTHVLLDAPGLGYFCQWQGTDILKVVWPPDRATAEWIPKPQWP